MSPNLNKGEALFARQRVNFPVLVRIKLSLSKEEREKEDAFDALKKDVDVAESDEKGRE